MLLLPAVSAGAQEPQSPVTTLEVSTNGATTVVGHSAEVEEPLPARSMVKKLKDLFSADSAAVLRSSERVEDAPGLIAIIDQTQIRDRGYRTLADLLQDIPGFYLEPDPRREVVITRGIPQSILIVYDGVPLIFDTGRDDLPVGEELSLAHVRRVEVLRGPGTALWGPNAFNGIVNVVSESGADVNGFRAQAEAGAGGTTLGSLEVAGGHKGEELEWSLAARAEEYRDARSYLDAPFQYSLQSPISIPIGPTQSGIGGLAPSWYGEAVGKASWRGFTLTGRYSDFDSYGALSSFSNSLLGASHDERRSIPTGSLRASWDGASDNASWDLGAFYLNSIHNDRYTLYATTPLEEYGGEIDQRSLTQNYGVDGRGEWNLGANAVSGGYFLAAKESTLATDYVDPTTGTRTTNTFRENFNNTVVQLYAQDRLLVGDRWRFTLGASFDRQSDFAPSINPRAGAVVRLGHGWIAKALYGEAILTPDVFDVVGISGGTASGNLSTVQGNHSLRPEKIRTAELAAEFRKGTIANASLSAYGSQIQDLINSQAADGVVQTENSGRVWAAGFEATGTWSPLRGLELNGTWTLSRTADTLSHLEDQPLPSGPYSVAVLGGTWSPLSDWSFYLGNRLVSNRPLSGPGDSSRLVPYTESDANVRWRPLGQPFSASLQLKNAFDAHYWNPNPGVPGRDPGVEIPGDRRSVLLQLEGRF